MEVKRISGRGSVSGCAHGRQSSIQRLSAAFAKQPQLGVCVVTILPHMGGAGGGVGDVTALYLGEQSFRSSFGIPSAAECFRGSNTPNL